MWSHERARGWSAWAAALIGWVLTLSAPSAWGQDRQDFQGWSALLANGATHAEAPAMRFWTDLHARRGGTNTVVIVRPGLGVDVNAWLTFWAGYAWVPVFDDAARERTDEHRIWEQMTLTYRTAPELGFTMQSRTRVEQRFSEAGSDIGHRLRQFVRFNWQPLPELPLGLALWDELFVGMNRTDWGAPSGIDQNRIFVGPFLRMAPWARLEAGYLFVYVDRDPDLYTRALAVNLFTSFRPPAR